MAYWFVCIVGEVLLLVVFECQLCIARTSYGIMVVLHCFTHKTINDACCCLSVQPLQAARLLTVG